MGVLPEESTTRRLLANNARSRANLLAHIPMSRQSKSLDGRHLQFTALETQGLWWHTTRIDQLPHSWRAHCTPFWKPASIIQKSDRHLG